MIKKAALILSILLALGSVPARAGVGVGVGVGKIVVDETLRPGIIYNLPNLPVINTGDSEGEYEVIISFSENQPELRPELKWFKFSPQKFTLKAKEIKQVGIMLNLPFKMEPGDYFAYLEAHPVVAEGGGGAKVGIAAAAKLYFKVVPANYFQGLYYRVVSFGKVYSPWPQRGLMLVGIIIALSLFRRFFNFQIGLRKPDNKNKPE